MKDLFAIFWTVLIFASVAWYAFLLFYVGIKAAVELWSMTRRLNERSDTADD